MIDSQGPPTTTKAELAKALGFDEVIDLTLEELGDGVRRIAGGGGRRHRDRQPRG